MKHLPSITAVLATTLIALSLSGRSVGETAAELRQFTGSQTRVVWVQDMGSGKDANTELNELRLMGFDTDDGGAERPIVAKISNYYRPLITRGGDKVIYTNYQTNQVFMVNWDGSDLHQIATGLAEAVWRDPGDGSDWVYVRAGADKKTRQAKGTIVERIQINRPQNKVTVWNNRSRPLEDFQVSADGMRAAGATPWPDAGMANLAKGAIVHDLGNGCWPAMSPDNSYRCWIFDGSHRKVRMYQPGVAKGWSVVLNNHPVLSKGEVYHPRWSNHPQFITATGPYGNIKKGGTEVDVFVGKFDGEFRSIEKWVQVTSNDRGNFYPDIWIESASRVAFKAVAETKTDVKPPASSGKRPPSVDAVTDSNGGPIFSWESGAKQGALIDSNSKQVVAAVPEPRGMAVYGRNHELDLYNGSFVVNDADDALTSVLTRSNKLSIEMLLTPARGKQDYPSQIVTFSSTRKSRNFSLTQDGEDLIFRLRTSETGPNVIKPVLRLCKLRTGQPNHVIVTYQNGRVVCYLDSEKVFDGAGPKGNFSTWASQHLIFGDEWTPGTGDWKGKLEGVAIYDRALSLAEACERYDYFKEKLRKRQPVEQVVVLARLLSVTPPPAPASIAPYRRALVVNEYEVVKVIAGKLADPKFQATHWGVLDAKMLPSQWEVGSLYRLTLEKFSDQPQMEGERVVSDSTDFGLDLFHTVAIGPSGGH